MIVLKTGLHEECGVFGVYSPQTTDVAAMTYVALYALQHRGQESCGIVVNDDGVFSSYKDLGLVSEVFSKDTLAHFPEGTMAVGHVRYGTTGGNTRSNCQPIEVSHQKGKMALAHNGNLTNALTLRDRLELSGAIFHTTSDTETIAYMITRERLGASSIEEAVSRAMESLEGAYSLVLMCENGRRAGSIWIQAPVLWQDAGRRLCGRVGELRAVCGGGGVCEGCSAWGDRGLPSGRCGIQKRALRNPEAEDLYF